MAVLQSILKSDFWITPVKSGFNTVRLSLGKTRICSELTLGQLWVHNQTTPVDFPLYVPDNLNNLEKSHLGAARLYIDTPDVTTKLRLECEVKGHPLECGVR